MKYLGTIIWNLISVIFAIAVLNSVFGSFETIVVALLVLILTGVNQGFASLALDNGRRFVLLYKKLADLGLEKDGSKKEYDLLNDLPPETIDEEEIKEAEELLDKISKKFYIAITGNFIVWVWAIIKILGSI